MYDYQFTDIALKQLSKLPKETAQRILDKLDYYCSSKHPLRYADFLTDSRLGSFRFRIGDYRVVFDIEDESIVVLAVGHRKSIYKKR